MKSGAVGLCALLLAGGCGGGGTVSDAGVDGSGGPGDASVTDMPAVDAHADAGCTSDADGDGHRSTACGGDDCNDSDPNAYPGNPERCDTLGHDEDCNPSTLGADGDLDGFVSTMCCNTQPDGMVACGTDCNDMEANIHPGAPEACNGVDDDCNGLVDDHDVRLTFYRDVDGDLEGDSSMPMMACTAPLGYVLTGGDCDDTRPNVHHGLPDGPTANCDGLDNDCDGTPDHGCPCIDGHTQACGMSSTPPCRLGTQTCAGAAWGACMGDIEPTVEVCNMVDDNCNGLVDDGATVACYVDGDHDAYAPAGATLMMICGDSLGHCPTGYTATAPTTAASRDCNDAAATVHPGAPELCNMVDDNCNGAIDDGARVSCYVDADHDAFAASGATVMSVCPDTLGHCPTGFTATAPADTATTDCNDAQATVHPGALEACNSVDDNCNGIVDETAGMMQWRDADGDGHGTSTGAPMTSCLPLTGYVTNHDDCNDADPLVHPGGTQRCDLTTDGDCDGIIGAMDRDSDTWCSTRPHVQPGSVCSTGGFAPGTCTVTNCADDPAHPGTTGWQNCNAGTGYSISGGGDEDGCETRLGADPNCTGCGQANLGCSTGPSTCASHGYTCIWSGSCPCRGSGSYCCG